VAGHAYLALAGNAGPLRIADFDLPCDLVTSRDCECRRRTRCIPARNDLFSLQHMRHGRPGHDDLTQLVVGLRIDNPENPALTSHLVQVLDLFPALSAPSAASTSFSQRSHNSSAVMLLWSTRTLKEVQHDDTSIGVAFEVDDLTTGVIGGGWSVLPAVAVAVLHRCTAQEWRGRWGAGMGRMGRKPESRAAL
jgi:hypothetical protein